MHGMEAITENGGYFIVWETWPQVEVMRCRVREEENDRFQHQWKSRVMWAEEWKP